MVVVYVSQGPNEEVLVKTSQEPGGKVCISVQADNPSLYLQMEDDESLWLQVKGEKGKNGDEKGVKGGERGKKGGEKGEKGYENLGKGSKSDNKAANNNFDSIMSKQTSEVEEQTSEVSSNTDPDNSDEEMGPERQWAKEGRKGNFASSAKGMWLAKESQARLDEARLEEARLEEAWKARLEEELGKKYYSLEEAREAARLEEEARLER